MKIQIIHSRDPDSECGLRVFIDDVEADSWESEDLDPGRGWGDADWQERIEDADTSTAYGKALHEELVRLVPAQQKYRTH